MADFFNKPEEKVEEKVEVEEVEKIKLGESEYSQEELQGMVGLASKVKEYEKNSGTEFEKLTSEFGKRGQTIGDLRKEIDEIKNRELQEKVETKQDLSEEEAIRQAQTQADKLGLVTKESVNRYVAESLEARDLLDSCKDLSDEINGKDGRPAFKTEEVLTYMRDTGFKNPMKAYKDKYEKEIDTWKEQQFAKRKPANLVTEQSTNVGSKQPDPVKVTRDNLESMVKESLWGNK